MDGSIESIVMLAMTFVAGGLVGGLVMWTVKGGNDE